MSLLHDRYELLRPLGEGGAGQTWLARDTHTGAQVTVKELRANLKGQGGALVAREARLLGQLDHPQIPRFVEAFVEDVRLVPRIHLVLEYVEGISLADAMQAHRPTRAEALRSIKDLLGILAWLHDRAPPVLHRDVKPHNVIVRPDGTLVLIDFGTATDAGDRTFLHTMVVGTLGYQAPEQIAGEPVPASDVYAAGVVALELLTRRRPRELLSVQTLKWERAAANLPDDVRTWLSKALAPSVKDRFRDAGEALRALPSPSAAPTSTRQPDEGRSRRPSRAAASRPPPRDRDRSGRWTHLRERFLRLNPTKMDVMTVVLVPAFAVFALSFFQTELRELAAGWGPAPEPAPIVVVDPVAQCEADGTRGCVAAAKQLREGPVREPDRAIDMLKRGCEAQDKTACFLLAEAFDAKGWRPPDPDEAVRWWRRACTLNATNACPILVSRIQQMPKPQRRPHIEQTVAQWAQACTDFSLRETAKFECYRLVDWFQHERFGLHDPQAYTAALDLGCAQGEAWMCWQRGILYESGHGGTPDPDLAVHHFVQACDAGVRGACDGVDRLEGKFSGRRANDASSGNP